MTLQQFIAELQQDIRARKRNAINEQGIARHLVIDSMDEENEESYRIGYACGIAKALEVLGEYMEHPNEIISEEEAQRLKIELRMK